MVYNRMKNRVKNALSRFWTRARGLVKRRADGGENKPKARVGSGDAPWRLIPLTFALAASVAVFAILTRCEYGAYVVIPPFGASSCEQWSQTFGTLSTSAGVGFLVFLMVEVVTVILAQMWIDRQRDLAARELEAAERKAEAAERKADFAELRAEIAERSRREDAEHAEQAERMLEMMERSRREDAERAERAERMLEMMDQVRREDAERAERREERLIALIEFLKNGKNNGAE